MHGWQVERLELEFGRRKMIPRYVCDLVAAVDVCTLSQGIPEQAHHLHT